MARWTGAIRRFAVAGAVLLLTAGVLSGALVGSGWASTRSVTVHVRTARVPVFAACPRAAAPPGCRVTIELRTAARVSHHKRGLMVGRATTLVAPGSGRRVQVSLTHLGRRLLRHESPLAVIATTVTTTPSTPASGTPTVPLPTPAPIPCRPVGPPVLPAAGPGPTAVVGGIYLSGGPTPDLNCVGPIGPTPAVGGTVQVLNAAGDVVATQTVADGQTFTIALAPGTYTIQAATPMYKVNGAIGYFCRDWTPFTVIDGNQTAVQVICNIP